MCPFALISESSDDIDYHALRKKYCAVNCCCSLFRLKISNLGVKINEEVKQTIRNKAYALFDINIEH